jgi:hypothetical protein
MSFIGNRRWLLEPTPAEAWNFATFGTLPTTAAFTGSGTNRMRFNSAGTLGAVAANVARFDYDGLSLDALGLLIETAAKTNGIRNKIGTGGSPTATLPTNWAWTAVSGLTREYVGSYTERGMTVLQFRVHGTTTGTSTQTMNMEATNHIASVQNDIRAHGAFVRHATLKPDRTTPTASTLTGVSSFKLAMAEYTAAAAFIATRNGSPIGLSDDDLTWTDQIFTVTAANAAFSRPVINFVTTHPNDVDFSFDVALPHATAGDYVGSPISPTASDDTRGVDALVITPRRMGSNWSAIIELAPMAFKSMVAFQIDAGSDDDRIYFQYDAAGTTLNWGAYVGAAQTAGAGVTDGAFIRGEPIRIALTAGGGSVTAKIAGNAAETIAVQPTVDRIRFGQNVAGTGTGAQYIRAYEVQTRKQTTGWLNASTAS